MKKTLLALLVACGGLAAQSQATEVKIGLGASSTNTGYGDGYDTQKNIVPLINIEADKYYVRINRAGYYLLNDKVNQFSIMVEANGDEWDSNETRHLKALNDRDASINAGFQYRNKQAYGVFSALIAGDVSGNSEGYYGEASFAFPWNATPKLEIRPSIGIQYLSDDYANYYYGVTSKEASKVAGLSSHDVGSATRPFLTLGGEYTINAQWSAVASVSAKQLSNDIQNSPLVSDSSETNITAGLSYKF